MASLTAKTNASPAANGFRRLADNLRKVAGGAVVQEVLGDAVSQIDAVARGRLERWTRTGYAAANTKVRRDAKGVEIGWPRYLDFHKGRGGKRDWPFARGIPPFVINRASKLLRERTKATIAQG